MKKILLAAMIVLVAFNSCKKSEVEDEKKPAEKTIVGSWFSGGDNVSSLLVKYFKVDSVVADFMSNNTYKVISYTKGAATQYTGTYTQTKPESGTIWNIKLEQSKPTAVTSEGIFEITEAGETFKMTYEVVQTQPSIQATPPTAKDGFGSSNGGALGKTNIQKFVKR